MHKTHLVLFDYTASSLPIFLKPWWSSKYKEKIYRYIYFLAWTHSSVFTNGGNNVTQFKLSSTDMRPFWIFWRNHFFRTSYWKYKNKYATFFQKTINVVSKRHVYYVVWLWNSFWRNRWFYKQENVPLTQDAYHFLH